MASATDLVGNTGNANLGIGGSNAISISPDHETGGFNAMQEVANKMMLQNHSFNVQMFNQKLKDRDDLYQALNKGQVTVGDINPEDRGAWEATKKAQNDAFYEMAQNGGVANKDAYRKYVQATTGLNEMATHLQARKIGIDQYNKDIANEPLKAQKDIITAQRDKQLAKPTTAMIDPYQKSLDFDADKLLGDIQKGAVVGSGGGGIPTSVTTQSVRTKQTPGKPTTTTTFEKSVPITGKRKGVQSVTTNTGLPAQTGGVVPQTNQIVYRNGLPYNVTSQYVDFNRLKQNANDLYLDKTGEGTELQNQFYDKFTDPNVMSHEEIKPTYDYMVKKAEEYNRARGFVPQPDGSMSAEDLANGAADTKKLIDAFNVPPDPQTGKRNINMSKPELASYFALAHMGSYANKTETLLKDEATLETQNKKIANDLKIRQQAVNQKGQLIKAQIDKIRTAIDNKTPEQQQQEFNKYWASNGTSILNTPTTFGGINGTIPAGSVPYEKARPIYTQDINGAPKLLKPIDGVPVYNVTDSHGQPTDKSKVIGYAGGHYETQFYNKTSGQTIDVNNIQEGFRKAKKNNPSLSEQDYLVNLGNAGITYRMLGDNGTSANIDDNGNNLRILDNKYKKKGQQDPIVDDGDLFEQSNDDE